MKSAPLNTLLVALSLVAVASPTASAFSAPPLGEQALVAEVHPFGVRGGLTFGQPDSFLGKFGIVQRVELRLELDASVLDMEYGLSGHHRWSVVGIAWNLGVGPLLAVRDQVSVGARTSASVAATLTFDIGDHFGVALYAGPVVDAASTVARRAQTRVTTNARLGVATKVWHPWVHAYVEGGATFASSSWLYGLGANAGMALVWPF